MIEGPVYFGGTTQTINRCIDKLGDLQLEAKWIVVFDTYLEGDLAKAVKKMEKRLNEKSPGLKLVIPGLAIQVQGRKGPNRRGRTPQMSRVWKGNSDSTKNVKFTLNVL